MTSASSTSYAAAAGGSSARGRVTITVAAFIFLPILAIGLLGVWQGDRLAPLFAIEPNNLAAVHAVLRGFLHLSEHGDSWLPMQHALELVKGPDRDALYEKLFFSAHVRFQYPPSSLLAVDLLSGLGLGSVRALNAINTLVFVLNAAAAGLLSWLLFRDEDGMRAAPDPRAMALFAAAAVFLFYPLLRAHLLGQIQLWIDLLFSLAVVAWLLERRFLAGLCIGVACTIKPQLGLLLLWGLLWREHRFAGGIVAALAPLLAVSLLFYGLHNHLAYLDVLGFLSRHGESYFANNSVNGILNWYLSSNDSLHWYENSLTPYNPFIHAGTLAATLLALVLLVAPPLLAKRQARLADLGVAAILTVVGSPVAWEHHYGILFPLYLVALRTLFAITEGVGRNLAIAALALSWILVADFIPFAGLLAHTPWVVVQAYCLFGALLLLAFFLEPGGGLRRNGARPP